MRAYLKKDNICTVPNLLSAVRLLLIPVIVWLYVIRRDHIGAVIAVAASGLTDLADGYIARRFDQISDFGKILDPVADKMTQAALIACLVARYERMKYLLILFLFKEITMGICSLLMIRKEKRVNSSKWYGKLNTAVLYAVMILLFLFPMMPENLADGMILLCMATVAFSMVRYLTGYFKVLLRKER